MLNPRNCRSDLYRENSSADVKLKRIEQIWHDRAQVKIKSPQTDIEIDHDIPDFLENLLPFHQDEIYKNYPKQLKMLILSAGWVVYNQKTIVIETEIICPACIDLLHSGNLITYSCAAIIAETLTDESFHTLFSISMCEIATSQRGINILWPELELSKHISCIQEKLSTKDFQLYRLAFALVSETFISDYLTQLCDATEIQPIFRHAVSLHKKDEIVHKNIFPMFVKELCKSLESKQKQVFMQGIVNAIRIFPMRETHAWEKILQQIIKLYGDPTIQLPNIQIENGVADYSALPDILKSIDIPFEQHHEDIVAQYSN